MKLTKKKRIIYSGIGVVIFVFGVQIISAAILWGYLSIMPFNHFVDIQNIQAYDIEVGEQVQKFTITRRAKFDIDARSIKEIYRIDNDIPNQLYALPESTFLYEKDGNGKELNFEITLKRPIQVVSEFYTIDRVCLDLPYGVEKCDTMRIDWQSVAEGQNTVRLEVPDIEDIDRLIITNE